MMHSHSKLRRLFTSGLALLALLVASAPALAGTMYFAEVLTATEFPVASNVRATLDAGVMQTDPLDILLDGAITPDAGLGSGYLSGTGDSIVYQHQFTPALAWESVTHATLLIGTIDDAFFDRSESVEIALNDAFWKSGNATFNLFGGNVTALFSNQNDTLEVRVTSLGGDSIVPFSMMVWKYETAGGPESGTGARPVPEPTALALFGIGVMIVSQATRRRS